MMHKRLPYILVAAGWILYFLPFFRLLPGNSDEGTLIAGATRVVAGQLPYRDFFEVMGPGTFYWLAGFFKLFGETWLATRICQLVTTLAITLLLYYLARRLQGGKGAAAVIFFSAVSFHSWNAISHHMDSNLFGLLAFVALVKWIDTRRSYWLFLAGTGAGLTTWFILPKGVLLCLSFALLSWILYRKESNFWTSLATLSGGFLLVITAGASLFWLAGGLPELIYSNLIWPLSNYGSVNAVPYGLGFRELYWQAFTTSFRSAFAPSLAVSISSFLSIPLLVLMALPALLLVLGFRLGSLSFERATLPYWMAGGAFWFAELHRKDLAHLAFGSPLLIILVFHLAGRLQGKWPGYVRQVIVTAAVTLALLNPLVALAAPYKTVTPRGTMFSSHPSNPILDFLNARVAPGEPVFIYPYAPIYYFLSAAKNPTRYSILMDRYNTRAQLHEVVQCLEENRVRYVIWDQTFPVWVKKWFPSYLATPQGEQIVEPYLTGHYKVIGGMDSGYQFLERKELSAPSLALSVGKP